MNSQRPPSDSHELDALIALYLEAIDRGERPDRPQFLAAHPDQAAGLGAFFADLDQVQAAHEQAAKNQGPHEPPAPELALTFLAPQGKPQHTSGVKYGTLIGGRYKLLENIGEGGMGSVWVAEQQQPVKRRVAIKLIKAGMDSRQVLARFDAERQALAMMDHPNIAKVFDGGMTEQGRPYFVMEYVKGVPFTEYCDKARLSLKERLILFIPVCQAVQHAHHKGIVHRDLKPSNILICLYDGRPVPKVIDFGLAKAMHQSLTDQSIFTGHGVMVGTPLYMSPEQAEHNNLDVDTRTDIYSLGVVLYELLTGTTPLERQQLQQAAYEEVRRLIQEVEPPRPSTRLSGSASLPSIAAQRSIDPKQLSRSLAGDLDWIVMKTLEKERSRRYETATGLARDIERFLNEEAVEACPPSRTYRLKKFIRKHRGQVIAASTLLLTLLVGIIGTTWGLFRATTAERAATESERLAVLSEHKALGALEQVTKERDAKEHQRKLAESAQQAESEQRAKSERQLVSGILRPIGFNKESLDPSELKSLADWSALSDSRLQLLALEVAFEDPATALRVACRADRAIHVCVGLSPERRAIALEVVSKKQRDMTADPRIRVAACWLALELGSADLPALAESVGYLGDEKNRAITEFKVFVRFVVSRTDPQQHRLVNRHAWDALIPVLGKITDEDDADKALVALAPRLEPTQVERGWDALIAMVEKDHLGCDGLVALAPALNQTQVIRSADILIAMLEKSSDGPDYVASNVLSALAPRLEPMQIVRSWDALVGVLEKSTAWPRYWSNAGFAALAPRLELAQIDRGGDALIAILEKTSDTSVCSAAGNALAALAPRLERTQAMHSGEALIAVLEKTTDYWHAVDSSGKALITLAPRLEPAQIVRAWDALVAVVEKTTDYDERSAATKALVTLARQLEPAQVVRCWDSLITVLAKSTTVEAHSMAGKAFVALAPRLASVDVARCWDTLIVVIENPKEYWWHAIDAAGEALVALAPRLEPAQVARGWDALNAVQERLTAENLGESENKAGHVARIVLMALAPRLEPTQVLRGGDTQIAVLEKSTDDTGFYDSAELLVALAPLLEPAQVVRAWDALVAVLDKPTDDDTLYMAGESLAALAPRLEPAQVMRGGNALVAVLEKSTDCATLGAAGEALAALAPRLKPTQVVRCADALLAAWEKSPEWPAVYSVGRRIVALAPWLEPVQIERVWDALVLALEQSLEVPEFAKVGDGLAALASRLGPEQVVRGWDALVSVLEKSTNQAVINDARRGLVALAQTRSDPRSLAKLLSHRGCVGELREIMLQRFEELLFHDGKPVFLTQPESETGATPSPPATPVPPPRRFHNLHDAATWIQQNWPDFDLETNHPVTRPK